MHWPVSKPRPETAKPGMLEKEWETGTLKPAQTPS